MKKDDRLYAVMGLFLPWITLILLIALATWYCDLLWLRAVCVVVAILNGSVTLRLAVNTLRILKNNRLS